MPARTPEDLGQQFMQALNAGDIEGLLQLYEPGSVLRPMPGQVVEGTAIRHAALPDRRAVGDGVEHLNSRA
jgi:hypothetical protein